MVFKNFLPLILGFNTVYSMLTQAPLAKEVDKTWRISYMSMQTPWQGEVQIPVSEEAKTCESLGPVIDEINNEIQNLFPQYMPGCTIKSVQGNAKEGKYTYDCNLTGSVFSAVVSVAESSQERRITRIQSYPEGYQTAATTIYEPCSNSVEPSGQPKQTTVKLQMNVSIEVIPGKVGDDPASGLPELCNWYTINGDQRCYTPTDLETAFAGSDRALGLAEIAIELNVGETQFSGSEEYCSDVIALSSQMPWVNDVKCTR